MDTGGDQPQHVIDRIRNIADGYLSKHQMESAIFWSGQAVCLSKNEPEDLLRLSECFVIEKQYHRALHLLKNHKLQNTDIRGCYLAAKAAFDSNELDEAVMIMENASSLIESAKRELILKENPPLTPATSKSAAGGKSSAKTTRSSTMQKSSMMEKEPDTDSLLEERRMLGSIFLLKGRILESMDNRELAADAFKEAVRIDVYCHEAFKALIRHQILTAAEEMELLEMMPFEQQCSSVEEQELVHFLHEMSLKKYNKPSDLKVPKTLVSTLNLNTDLIIAKAERHFYNCDYTQCYRLTTSVMKNNSFHADCLPIHISCLVELHKPNDLFHLAHRLVDLYPEWVISWFAVGCYYYMVSRHEFARRYLSKATMLDRVFGPAWLAYGHSFALENEHDQAMAAYFKAFQLMKGCHLPLLYIGVEYGLTNNPKLAEQFFSQALEIAPKDPFVLHEMGVTCFQNCDYTSAEKYFSMAFQQIKGVQGAVLSSKWESLLNNLGHTMRKLSRYDEALDYHQQALVLNPLSHSTYASLGYVHALQGEYIFAVESFHKALSLKRDDVFSSKMLKSVIEQLMSEATPYEDYPEEIPRLERLDTASIHVPQLHSFGTPCGDNRGGPSPPLTSSPVNVTSENDGINQSNSLDVEMANITNDE